MHDTEPEPHMTRRTFLAAGGAGTAGLLAASAHPLTASAAAPEPQPPAPGTGGYELIAVPAQNGQWGIAVRDTQTSALVLTELAPIQVMVKVGDFPADFSSGYSTATAGNGTLRASGDVRTAAGSVYHFEDVYTRDGDDFVLERQVTVRQASNLLEMGFNSRFTLGPAQQGTMTGYDFFVPGVWYGDNTGLPRGALASDYSDSYFYIREMRLPLPITMMREKATGNTVALGHENPRPATGAFVQESRGDWWIDADIQYAAIGAQRVPQPKLAFVYPAMEGEKSYISAPWTYRSHPVQQGFTHSYSIRMTISQYGAFPAAVKDIWRHYWNVFRPPARPAPTAAIYANGVALLSNLTRPYNGYPGMPFRTRLPTGQPDAVSYMIGYVGQQAPAAYQMLRAGYARGDTQMTANGRAILDFWATQSGLPNGLPKLWIDGNTPTWRAWYPTYIRVAADGMDGVLDAARFMRARGQPVTAWEDYVTKFGNFLAASQNSDGSFYRAYNWDGSVNDNAKTNTTHPVRFLVKLHQFTGDTRYLAAAERAGQFAAAAYQGNMKYLGGTPDNPDVIDKEAGGMAMNAFLALYDATQDQQWLAAASQAADYCETWLFSWAYQVETPRKAYAQDGSLALSLIATGGSGTDNWLTYEGANFYRLSLLTGDPHYADVARVLTSTAYRTTEYQGNPLGYDQPGLLEEAMSVVDLDYNGTNVWLPWCTVAQIEPLATLQDIFGSMDIDTIEKLPLPDRQRLARSAGQNIM